jgi:MoxR-like ATPase
MAIDFKTFNTIVSHLIASRFPILLRGRHGIGKSTLVYQLAKKQGLPVVERRASQMTEGDLLGLPKVKGKVTTWLPPEWLHQACNQPVALFLDEVDRATTEV